MQAENIDIFSKFEKRNESMTFSDLFFRNLDNILAGAFAATGANVAAVSSGHPLLFAITISLGSFATWFLYTAGSAIVGVLMKKAAERLMDWAQTFGTVQIARLKLYWRIRKNKP
jgi:hypothetical protein